MATFTATSNNYDGRQLRLVITQTQNIASNKSTLNWTLYSEGGSVAYYLVYATTIKINGTQVYYKGDTQWNTYQFPAAKGSVSGSIEVSHNSDGSLSIPIYFYTGVYASKWKANYGGTFTLDKIPRQANLSAAPNFNDEGNPTITYSNPAGTAVTSLDACISLTGSKDDIAYRAVSKTGTSYTFNLTDAERNVLRNATTTGNSRTVKFYLRTVIGGNTFYSILDKTLSIVNATPTLSPSVYDSNTTITALTGDSSKFVKYYSDAAYTVGAAALKGASISSRSVTCGNKSGSAASGTLNDVESATFVFYAKDSRGNSVSQTITKTLINYVKLTCNLSGDNPTTDGDMTFKISGNYFNGSFGATANILTVQYRYKENDGDYGDWITVTPTLSGNTYSVSNEITGLDYKSVYTFQARATDKIATVPTEEKKVKTTPVFDWGENDFAFNVPVTFNAGIEGGNKVLWSGGMYMNATHTITLSEAISAQPHGIILVFSGYSGGALDSSFNTFFVSKEQVSLFPNCGHTFLLGINAGFSKMGAKYLYFTDTTITGNASNTATGANSGITFDNSYYVLRYVIGV